jgi:hypothetical protein
MEVQSDIEGRCLCGAKLRRSDQRCRRPAGHGTGHPGWGTCGLHGGNLPTNSRRWEREAVLAEAARLKYRRFTREADGLHEGFKVFFEEDINRMTTGEVLGLRPPPDVVIYE